MTVNTLGRDLQSGKARAAAWLPPLVPFAIATFALSALVSYHLRADGAPDSRTPRRFTVINSSVAMVQSNTAWGASDGNAEVIAATPAEIETATVRM